jgi:hypothetical protein
MAVRSRMVMVMVVAWSLARRKWKVEDPVDKNTVKLAYLKSGLYITRT